MSAIFKRFVFALAFTAAVCAQSGGTNEWWVFGGNAQRNGWEKNEQKFTKDDVANFCLLWQRKLYIPRLGVGSLLPPLIGEFALVPGSDNSLWSMDASRGTLGWYKPGDEPVKNKKKERPCGGSLTAAPALSGGVALHSISKTSAARSAVYLLTGDGKLRLLNELDGSEIGEPLSFVPAGVMAQPLNISGETIYTSTHSGCGQESAVWSIDTSKAEPKAKSFKLGAEVAGVGGTALGSDGTLFVQTQYGTLEPNAGKWGGALLALTPDLMVSQYFAVPLTEAKKSAEDMNLTSPLVFTFKGEELVVTANKDGRLYVLRASSVGTEDHHRYRSRSMIVPTMDEDKEHGIWGGLSSWEDTDGSRYVLAPVWGPVSKDIQAALPKAKAPNGSIVAFKMASGIDGEPVLKPVWVSRDLDSPGVPVIEGGVVFALSNGKFGSDRRPRKNAHAMLFALDGTTGEKMYSTGDDLTAAGNLTGMTVANGRVYFLTVDNTVQVFGMYQEQ